MRNHARKKDRKTICATQKGREKKTQQQQTNKKKKTEKEKIRDLVENGSFPIKPCPVLQISPRF